MDEIIEKIKDENVRGFSATLASLIENTPYSEKPMKFHLQAYASNIMHIPLDATYAQLARGDFGEHKHHICVIKRCYELGLFPKEYV